MFLNVKSFFQEILSTIITMSKTKGFLVFFILLLLYVECITFGQNCLYNVRNPVFLLLCAAAVIPIVVVLVKLFSKIPMLEFSDENITRKQQRKFALKIFLITFCICMLWFIAFYPGGFNYDSINQYKQVVTGQYNNWHPVLHTWLFFTIPLHIYNNPATIVFMQLIYFTLSVTYLFSTLHKYHYSKRFMLLSYFFIMFNPITIQTALFAYKDSAMSTFTLLIFTQLVHIYNSDGAWLKKISHLIAFSALLFLITGIRHNAMLLTIPICCILFGIKSIRKQILISAFSVITALAVLNFVIFPVFNVAKPGERRLEVVGLPMTILSYVYMNDRNSMDEETRKFMDSLATQKEWNEKFDNTFNSMKLINSKVKMRSKVDNEGISKIMKYTIRTIRNSPRCSFEGFCKLTSLVWSIDEKANWDVTYLVTNHPFNVEYLKIDYSGFAPFKQLINSYHQMIRHSPLEYLFYYTGAIILFLLFLFVAKYGKQKLSRLCVIFPPLIYNIGTMFLLSGYDFRFFHYNFLIIIPILCIMLGKRKLENDA